MTSRRTAPGPDARELVDVADEDEARARGDGLGQRVGRGQIEHRGLVDDDGAARRWVGRGHA